MDLLVYLARHPGEVVSKDRILEHVWQKRFVAESVLSRSVADLRRLLGDEAGQPRVIETIAKRGYRLVAKVDPLTPASRGSAGAVGTRPSISVLPFLDLGPSRDQEYFCDGLAEELTNRLAQLRGLRVVARTSACAFKGRAVDIRDIGRQLGVGAVIEGSVQRVDDRVRVTVQLIDATDGCHLWSGRFDHAAGDVLALEDEIADAVLSQVRGALVPGTLARGVRRQTSNPAAHDLYWQGRHHTSRRDRAGLVRALECYERAVALDANYAAAHVGIAECGVLTAFLGFARPSEVIPGAKAAVERALCIDRDFAAAHAVLAHESGMFEWRWEKAEWHFGKALELSPDLALARLWYSHLLTALGRFDEAIAQAERACESDPLDPGTQMWLGYPHYCARQCDRAVQCYLGILERDPSFAPARFHLGRAYEVQGELEAAVEQFRLAGPEFPLAVACLADASRRLGRHEDHRRAVEQLKRLARTGYVSSLAWARAHAGEPDTRLQWITRAFDEREGMVPLLATDPYADSLRDAPAFRALLDRLNLPGRAATLPVG